MKARNSFFLVLLLQGFILINNADASGPGASTPAVHPTTPAATPSLTPVTPEDIAVCKTGVTLMTFFRAKSHLADYRHARSLTMKDPINATAACLDINEKFEKDMEVQKTRMEKCQNVKSEEEIYEIFEEKKEPGSPPIREKIMAKLNAFSFAEECPPASEALRGIIENLKPIKDTLQFCQNSSQGLDQLMQFSSICR